MASKSHKCTCKHRLGYIIIDTMGRPYIEDENGIIYPQWTENKAELFPTYEAARSARNRKARRDVSDELLYYKDPSPELRKAFQKDATATLKIVRLV